MGCLFACFGSSKDPKRLKKHRNSPHTDHRSTVQRNVIPQSIQSASVHTFPDYSNSKLLHSVLETGNRSISTIEEVTSVKPHEHEHEHVVLPQEDAASVHGKKQDLKEEKLAESGKPEFSSEDFVVPLSPNFRSSCPSVHRYKDCKDSDDEDEAFDDHLANDENDEKEISHVADCSTNDSGLNRKHGRHRNAYVSPVLNPVENLSEWNAEKSKGALPSTPQKENLEQESAVEEYSSKSSREVSVDASLCNWLASSEATPVTKITTTMALEAEITPEKSSTLQRSSSLRSSRHGEMPVVGQGVSDTDRGSASSFKGIPNTTSKYREDKTVKWHSTPFETRLERALNSSGVSTA